MTKIKDTLSNSLTFSVLLFIISGLFLGLTFCIVFYEKEMTYISNLCLLIGIFLVAVGTYVICNFMDGISDILLKLNFKIEIMNKEKENDRKTS